MDNDSKKRLMRTGAIMIAITLFVKILGLIRDILIAGAYGTGLYSVAFETASRLPLTLFDFVIGGVITASFIPIYIKIRDEKGKDDADGYAGGYFFCVLIIAAVISAAGILLSSPLIGLLAPDISAETAEIAAGLSRVMFPMIIFCGAAFCFVGYLQANGNYIVPVLISVVSNVIVIAYIVSLNDVFGVLGLAVSMLGGWLMQAACQLPSAVKIGFSFRPRLLPKNSIRDTLRLAVPVLISSWAIPLCSLLNIRFASSIAEGRAISAFSYAYKIELVAAGVFSFVAVNLIFPVMAGKNADKKEQGAFLSSSARSLLLLVIPASVGLFILAPEFVSVLYEHGAFDAEDTVLTASALRGFAAGIPFFAVFEVVTKFFVARRQAIYPLYASLAVIAFDTGLAFPLRAWLGVMGVALAMSVGTAAGTAVLLVILKKKAADVFENGTVGDIGKTVLASAVMGGAVYLAAVLLRTSGTALRLAVCIVGGIAIYAAALAAMKSKSFSDALSALKGNDKSDTDGGDTSE
ncbi:MAG: murein biosynthesis integral membrane protein MurJ [Clostridia bacterium]|nr:murein biosynthesis integral membrane protein MurJ [Clostridia bacterium]